MSITFKDAEGLDPITTNFVSTKNFAHFFADPNLNTPLGKGWQFDACFLTKKYAKYAELYHNFEVRPDDVWNITFPKTGSTWGQEIIYLLDNNIINDVGSTVPIDKRFHFLEFHTLFDNNAVDFLDISDQLNAMPSPRYIKSHLPVSLLPKQLWTVKPKIIYTARNPKDTAISFFHHYRSILDYGGSVQDFLRAFKQSEVIYAPYHSHILDFWCMRNEENILFIQYEDMKNDLKSVLKNVATFLGKSYGVEDLAKLEQRLSFKSMSSNESCNQQSLIQHFRQTMKLEVNDFKFLRKGEVGGYKSDMTVDDAKEFDRWHQERSLAYINLHKNRTTHLNELPSCIADVI